MVKSLAYSPDGLYLAVAATYLLHDDSVRGEVVLWDLRRSKRLATLSKSPFSAHVAISCPK